MTSRRPATALVALILAIGLALPAVAAERTTGEQLSLLGPGDCPVTSYAADTGFYVSHGNAFNPTQETGSDYGEWRFQLEVDGNLLPLSTIRITEVRDGAPEGFWLSKSFVYNFPDGLSVGWHNLTGIWTDPSGAVTLVEDCDIEFN
jgi:hypothetical protein